MFIPLKDLNPSRSTPFVNYLLISINVFVFAYELTLPHRVQQSFQLANAMVPSRFEHGLAGHGSVAMALLPLLTSMFLHGGLLHIAGNMLFLWIFGDNVEDFFGHAGYLVFYLFCGIAAGLSQVVSNLDSSVPALGASGAISGIMGAYALLYPRAQILTLVVIFLVPLPAFLILGFWFVLQFLQGLSSLGVMANGGVAWWAHIGGFLVGMAAALVFRRR